MNYHPISPDQNVHITFLGCGHITAAHAKAVKKINKNIEISFASRTLEKARIYSLKYNGKYAYGSYEEAIESPDVNVVMINTPPHLHFDLAKKSLEHGKHVIVEKPPFFHSGDFDILGPLAEKNHLHLMVAENYFYRPLRSHIKYAMQSGLIGQPLFIQINATKLQKSKQDWREEKSLIGYGALFEGGIHWANFVNNIGLSVSKVTGFQPVRQAELERSMQVVAETEEGAIINLLYSWEVNTLFFGLRISRIYGTEGSVTFESNGLFTFIRGRKWSVKLPVFSKMTGNKPMWEDFIHSITIGVKPQFHWEDAKRDLWYVEQAYKTN